MSFVEKPFTKSIKRENLTYIFKHYNNDYIQTSNKMVIGALVKHIGPVKPQRIERSFFERDTI